MAKVRRPGIYRLVFDTFGDDAGQDPARRDDADRQTRSLAGLAVTLAVLVMSLFLVHQLARIASLDDCLLAGQNNCDLLLARLH